MLNRGFTLIEVLITLIILMFGLLGIAGLMAKGQRASFEAYQRQAALAVANDIAERMRANRAQAPAYAAGAPLATPVGNRDLYDDLLGGTTKNCGAENCTTAELVAYDLALWEGLLRGYAERAGGNLIGGALTARGCVEDTTVAPAACPVPGNLTSVARNYRVSVAWQGNEATFAPPAGTCAENQFGNDAQRRLISLNLLILLPCP